MMSMNNIVRFLLFSLAAPSIAAAPAPEKPGLDLGVVSGADDHEYAQNVERNTVPDLVDVFRNIRRVKAREVLPARDTSFTNPMVVARQDSSSPDPSSSVTDPPTSTTSTTDSTDSTASSETSSSSTVTPPPTTTSSSTGDNSETPTSTESTATPTQTPTMTTSTTSSTSSEPTSTPTETTAFTSTVTSTTRGPDGDMVTFTATTVIHITPTAQDQATSTGPEPGLQTNSAFAVNGFAREWFAMVGGAAIAAVVL